MILKRALAAAAVITLFSLTPAEAHIFGAGGAGCAQGVAHPFVGLDHLLAVGAAVGMSGYPLPGVEHGVAASVIALGALIAFGLRPPLIASGGLIGLFACCVVTPMALNCWWLRRPPHMERA